MSPSKVPVTILSGQLGSGKSTLLRRILQNRSQFKFAVIMNEFAQTADIEGKSLQLTVANEGTEFQEWLELDNGCLCCSAQDHGVRAIESLMERRGSFDYIIIETSGVADPSQIATLFWLDSALESVLYLDGIVTAVDSLNFEIQLEEEARDASGTVTKQIAVADSLYLTKLDLVDDAKLARVKQHISAINPGANLNDSSQDLSSTLSKLLNLDAFSTFCDPQASLPPDLSSRLRQETRTEGIVVGHQGIGTLQIDLPILDRVNDSDCAFDRVFRKLLWEGVIGDDEYVGDGLEPRILRAKGLLKDANGKCFILQAVRDTYEIQEIGEEVEAAARLVLIGKDMDPSLKERFLAQIS
ncbi:hypothetical protein CROQUDRAFT_719441 [Cronartium quercuum f. sp. fusiforme G11]|uniref:CobW C-terminal domain-containing protein n=1 Tax=Cronartium quercuum f. sp. fusiforme G11 TaxID=708437 RepID=A0A9P6TH74_9BASI|nr:hypothetical protein CROQUDRAFT_719441 [Cronartium quercuum f. sp. fusiforme G11]